MPYPTPRTSIWESLVGATGHAVVTSLSLTGCANNSYIAQIEGEKMLAERPDFVRAVDQITTGLGYRIQNEVDDHALREWHLGYANHTGTRDRIQLEINFLMRACALTPSRASSCERWEEICRILALAALDSSLAHGLFGSD